MNVAIPLAKSFAERGVSDSPPNDYSSNGKVEACVDLGMSELSDLLDKIEIIVHYLFNVVSGIDVETSTFILSTMVR